jgi:hypothetical protein
LAANARASAAFASRATSAAKQAAEAQAAAAKAAAAKQQAAKEAAAKAAAAAKTRAALDLDGLAAAMPKRTATPPLDLEALAAGARRAAPPRPAGPPAPAAAQPARLTGDEAALLRAKLIRLWNPNCGAEGAAKVVVRVEMRLTPDGRILQARDLEPGRSQSDPISAAAAARALTAVARGQPYAELPRDRYDAWREIVVNFNAAQACRN